jgi:hypothetical protein
MALPRSARCTPDSCFCRSLASARLYRATFVSLCGTILIRELTRVRVVQSLTSFVEGVDAGQPGASLTITDVGDGVGILDWVHSGLIDSIFGDVKCTL